MPNTRFVSFTRESVTVQLSHKRIIIMHKIFVDPKNSSRTELSSSRQFLSSKDIYLFCSSNSASVEALFF